MKYKKLLVFVTVLFFLTVSVICFSTLFKVVDVSVQATVVSSSNEQVLEKTEACLQNYSGKNLVFVNEGELKNEIEGQSPYVKVEKVEKIYPNKIKVTVTERKEAYVVNYDNSFYVLDDEFYCVAKRTENVANVPNHRNILLNLNVADYSVDALQVNKTFTLNDEVSQSSLQSLTSVVLDKNDVISSITVKVKENAYYNRQITISMVEGVNFVLDKANENVTSKFNFAYSQYLLMPNKSYAVFTVSVSEQTGDYILS